MSPSRYHTTKNPIIYYNAYYIWGDKSCHWTNVYKSWYNGGKSTLKHIFYTSDVISIKRQTKWALPPVIIYSWLNSHQKKGHPLLISAFPMDKTMISYTFIPFGKVFSITLSQNEAMKYMSGFLDIASFLNSHPQTVSTSFWMFQKEIVIQETGIYDILVF